MTGVQTCALPIWVKYEPVVRKGWIALEGCVTPDGKLGYTQQVGADPKSFKPPCSACKEKGGLSIEAA